MTYNLSETENPEWLEELRQIWEPKKEYIEKDLWVIRNFLTQEEIDWLHKEADDPEGWYPTMRSPYGQNTKNKFIGYIPQYGEDGVLLPPHPSLNPQFREDAQAIFSPINDRLESVLPKYFAGAGAFQSLFEVPDKQIIQELGRNVDYAMPWHYERDDEDEDEYQRTIVNTNDKKIVSTNKISASFNVYINDNFTGGILQFKNKSYSIRPEPGMLVNIPIYKEFEHRVTKVIGGNRHTLYGRCWDTLDGLFISSRDDC